MCVLVEFLNVGDKDEVVVVEGVEVSFVFIIEDVEVNVEV